jgi:hypothetical protein
MICRRPNGRIQIAFTYRDEAGRKVRFRRDASVQTMTAARAEDARLQALAAATGMPEARSDAPTLDAYISGTFATLYMPTFRESTRIRYTALLRQGILETFGAKRLDTITAMQLRASAGPATCRQDRHQSTARIRPDPETVTDGTDGSVTRVGVHSVCEKHTHYTPLPGDGSYPSHPSPHHPRGPQ